jgi:hypothetical protein
MARACDTPTTVVFKVRYLGISKYAVLPDGQIFQGFEEVAPSQGAVSLPRFDIRGSDCCSEIPSSPIRITIRG